MVTNCQGYGPDERTNRMNNQCCLTWIVGRPGTADQMASWVTPNQWSTRTVRR